MVAVKCWRASVYFRINTFIYFFSNISRREIINLGACRPQSKPKATSVHVTTQSTSPNGTFDHINPDFLNNIIMTVQTEIGCMIRHSLPKRDKRIIARGLRFVCQFS